MGARPVRSSTAFWWRVLDVLAVVTVLPLLAAAGLSVRAAWQVYHPKRRPVRQTPASFGMEAERVAISGADGLKLAGWYIPTETAAVDTTAADARVGVVLAHGLARNSGMLMPLAKALHDAGHPVLTYDLRNYGESERDGLWRGQSPRYAIDHRAVVDHLAGRIGEGAAIACLGMSTSSWTALEMARLQPDLVRTVICDSGPTLHLGDTLGRMYGAMRGLLPRWLRGTLMFHVTRAVFTRAALFFLNPVPWPHDFGEKDVRLLFIAGDSDPIARPEDIRAQVVHYPGAEVWFVPGAGHMQAHVLAAKEYTERVLAALPTGTDRADRAGG